MRNSPYLNSSWRSEVARRHRHRRLLRQWIPCNTVAPARLIPNLRQMYGVKLESNEGRVDPERGELESSSAGTGLETPGQQCPPNEGIWETGRTTADGILTAGVGSNQGGKHFFAHGTSEEHGDVCRHLFTNGTRRCASRDNCDPGKTQAQDH